MESTSYKELPVFEPFFPNRYATIHFIYFLKIKIKMKKEWKVWHEGVKSLIYKEIMSKEVWHFSGTSLAIATLLIMWNVFYKKNYRNSGLLRGPPDRPGGSPKWGIAIRENP
jgi:hypothetical protein